MMKPKILAGDLFCGCGGVSEGLHQAVEMMDRTMQLVAVNHWETAIETHSKNHPTATHLCHSIDSIDPRKAVPGGHLDILIAAPECTHHSRARGGKPMNDQSRSTAWNILNWLDALTVKCLLMENVPEFVDWGPLYPDDHPVEKLRNRPIPEEKGKFFRNFCRNLRTLGYSVDYRFLVCADYGDPTTRRRLFLMARKGRKNPVFPQASHHQSGSLPLLGQAQWKPARDIINWSCQGNSIFTRKKPLADATLRRIEAGLLKFGGMAFTLGQPSCSAPRNLDTPLATLAGAGAISLCEPYLVVLRKNMDGKSLDEPIPTLTTAGNYGIVEPFLIEYHGATGGIERVRSLNVPIATLDTSNRFGLCHPTFSHNGQHYGFDLLFRMLQPHELAAAHSFPSDYEFAGNKAEVTMQIGNSVPVKTSRALCYSALRGILQ